MPFNNNKRKHSLRNHPYYENLDSYLAVGIAESFEPPFGESESEQETSRLAAWQYLVDFDLLPGLQGWFGRTAKDLLDKDLIHPKIIRGGTRRQLLKISGFGRATETSPP